MKIEKRMTTSLTPKQENDKIKVGNTRMIKQHQIHIWKRSTFQEENKQNTNTHQPKSFYNFQYISGIQKK